MSAYLSPGASIVEELMSIGFLCGYTGTPSIYEAHEIVKRCASIGPHGWGLALLAVNAMLSGGDLPYNKVSAIPFGYVDRLRGVWVIDSGRLVKEGLIRDEGFYLVRYEVSTPAETEEGKPARYVYEKPQAFGIVIAYCEDKCGAPGGERLTWRCFLIQQTGRDNYPWIAMIPTDEACIRMIALAREGKTSLTWEEEQEWIRSHGRLVEEEQTGGEESELEEFYGDEELFDEPSE